MEDDKFKKITKTVGRTFGVLTWVCVMSLMVALTLKIITMLF